MYEYWRLALSRAKNCIKFSLSPHFLVNQAMAIDADVPVPKQLCLLYEVDLSLLFQDEATTNRKPSLTLKKSIASIISNNLLNESHLLKSLSADSWHGLYVLTDPNIESWKKIKTHSLNVYCAIDQLIESPKEAEQQQQPNGYHHPPLNVIFHNVEVNGVAGGEGRGAGAGGGGAGGNGGGAGDNGGGANDNAAGGGADGEDGGGVEDQFDEITLVLRDMGNNQIETHIGHLPRNVDYQDYDEVEDRICRIIQEFQGQNISCVMFEFFTEDVATHEQIQVDPLMIEWEDMFGIVTRIVAAVVFEI